jgi:hypothetical protein
VPISTSIGILGRVLWLGLIVKLDDLDLAATELATLLGDEQLYRMRDVLAELRERARVGQHQPELERLGLRDGPAGRDRRGGCQRGAALDDASTRYTANCSGGHCRPP